MTGIESGEWVQIIAGLDNGERVVTSAQFMLDSEASLAGSFRRLSDAERDAPNSKTAMVFGSGVVEELDRGERWLIIRHGPIDALGWPGMTMKFDALPVVELNRVRTGQNVHFAIRPDQQGVYRVEMIHLVDEPEDKIAPPPSPHNHDGEGS